MDSSTQEPVVPRVRPKRLRRDRQRVHCSAHKTNGAVCPNWAINGGNVCAAHGGRAPQVKQAARLRLAAMVSPALEVLAKAMKPSGFGKRLPVRPELMVAAAKDVLDRNGLKSREEVQIVHEFSPERYKDISDEELATLIALAKKVAVATDAADS